MTLLRQRKTLCRGRSNRAFRTFGVPLHAFKYAVRIMLVGALWLFVDCCKSDKALPLQDSPVLKNDTAAVVGPYDIGIQQVQTLCRAAGISPTEAVNRLIFDALTAAAAREAGYESRARYRVQRRAILARTMTDELKKQSETQAISDELVDEFTRLHWMQLDRPPARHVIHAVVMSDDNAQANGAEKAQAVALDIAAATAGVKDADAFKIAAESVDSRGLNVLVQNLDPVTEDGRVVDPDVVRGVKKSAGEKTNRYDRQFVHYVFSLREPGQIAGPFTTRFGVHVLMYLQQIDSMHLPFEKRKQLLTPEIRTHFARKRYEAIVTELKRQTETSVQRNADALLALLYDRLSSRGR